MLRGGVDKLKNVVFFERDYADVWFRDYGPTFIVNRHQKQIAIVNWIFNAWGGKYKDLMKDSQMPYFISEDMGLPFFKPVVVLEGGAIDVNGQGSLLTTEQCILNVNRNPGMSKADMERCFFEYLGAGNVIWLKGGLVDDDTDGHVDNVARFVDARTVLCA
jgi:agmatine deiminase